MRIAVPFDKAAGTIAEQFDRTEAFRLYNLENGQIVSSLSLPAFGTGNEAMAEFLKTARADVVICGGITARGRQLLGAEGIAVYPGFGVMLTVTVVPLFALEADSPAVPMVSLLESAERLIEEF